MAIRTREKARIFDIPKFWRTLTRLGVNSQDAATARQLRLVNGFSFGLSLVFLSIFILMVTSLWLNGHSPSTSGLIIMSLGVGLPLLTPLLHRVSTSAGAAYILLFLFVLVAASQAKQGRAQGIEFAFIALVGIVPLLFGVRKRLINITLSMLLFLFFVLCSLFLSTGTRR